MLSWEIQRGVSPFTDGDSCKIDEVWERSVYASPFASPPILAHLAQSALAAGATPVAAIGTDADGQIAALWPLVEWPSGRLEFLHGRLCDHGTALFRSDVDTSALSDGLAAVLETTPATRLFLTNLPAWDGSREASSQALATCGWAARTLEANADPVLAEEPGSDLAERLAARVQGRSLRNYANRLAKQEGYAFEVFDDATDLAQWAEDFCDCHDWRWASTDTPSQLASPAQRRDFEDTLRAWSETGSLLRFAIRVGGQRIACAVVLRAGDRLIYHRISHSPAHDRTRAATVLVRNLVLWMAQNEEPTLDFGLGDEAYKYRFASREERLWRVYGAKSRFSGDRITGWIDATIRSSESLQSTWDRVGNRWLRGRVLSRIRRTRSQVRQSIARLGGRRAPDAWPASEPDATPHSSLHAASGIESEPPAACTAIAMADVLARIETHWPLAVEDRPGFYERRHAGWIPHALGEVGASGPLVWLWKDPKRPNRWWLRSNDSDGLATRSGATAKLLEGVRSLAGPGRRVFAEAGEAGGFEESDLRSAGFTPAGPSPD